VAEDRYGIAELAELGGVSRRTVRYYIQERLLPPPLGVGRGRHYGQDHLDRLVAVKAMQEKGASLGEIRRVLSGGRPAPGGPVPHVPRTPWMRLSLMPGLELHVSSALRLPAPGRLEELAETCRGYFRLEGGVEEE